MIKRVLVLDDDESLSRFLGRWLQRQGLAVTVASNLEEARERLESNFYDMAFVDLHLPDGHGADIMQWAAANNRVGRTFAITGVARCETVVRAMQCGAYTVIEKPFDFDALKALIAEYKGPDPKTWRDRFAPNILGNAQSLSETLEVTARVAAAACTVVIHGESGTGKELFAHALHRGSDRADGPFVAVNCAAIPDALIEDEMFGHNTGAYTGAEGPRLGRVVSADGGTLFLDEIGDMPLAAQAKLLRVLQEGTLSPVGSDEVIQVDVRIVAATHRDLWELVEQGKFREDLLYRLDVVSLELPPLRERGEDVIELAKHFAHVACQASGQPTKVISEEAQTRLRKHPWPGNVRELGNCIERAVLMTGGDSITPKQLRLVPPRRPSSVVNKVVTQPAQATLPEETTKESMDLKRALKTKELELITKALEKTQGNRSEAAALLGLNRTTLVEKLKRAAS